MKIKKNILILFLIISFSNDIFATHQTEDILIWNKDTFYLYDSPLDLIPDIRAKIFESQTTTIRILSSCWRGYNAEWKIENNQLYLTNVFDAGGEKNLNKNIEKILNKKFVNGKIKADWVDSTFWCGKNDTYLNPWFSIYEIEYKLYFSSGLLQSYELSKTNSCIYYENKDSLNNFIYSNVNWDSIPEPISSGYVSVSFSTDKEGKIIEIMGINTSEPYGLVKEALRIVGKLPCWKTVCHEGLQVNEFWKIDIIFNEDNKIRYYKKR
jgi:hypothetical protein